MKNPQFSTFSELTKRQNAAQQENHKASYNSSGSYQSAF